LGSGAGFLSQYVPNLITSDVFQCRDSRLLLDARALPFSPRSLKAIVMVNVLHHIPDVRSFFGEALNCVRSGGSIIMVEPWVSTWSRLVYKYLHHEPFDAETESWTFPQGGPLSGANGALPWIVFQRDRRTFESEFRELELLTVWPLMPFRYLLSGGVSMRQLMPDATFGFWRRLESHLMRWPQHWSMFAMIHIRRR
jgi:SAM-dependent methyltransferase